MLSALSVAEFCRTEAARFAAISRLRASWRCLSTESEALSRFSCDLDLAGFFGTGGGAFFSSFKDEEQRTPHYAMVTHIPFFSIHLYVSSFACQLITFKRFLFRVKFPKKCVKIKCHLNTIH